MSPIITADGPPPELGPLCSKGIGVDVTVRVGKLAGVGDGLGLGEGEDGAATSSVGSTGGTGASPSTWGGAGSGGGGGGGGGAGGGGASPSVATTSKASPGIAFKSPRRSSLQRGSGAPEMYQSLPLSATNMPYLLRAVHITWTSALKPPQLYQGFMRKRSPMGGTFGSVLLEA